jgi:hypothetical protein
MHNKSKIIIWDNFIKMAKIHIRNEIKKWFHAIITTDILVSNVFTKYPIPPLIK